MALVAAETYIIDNTTLMTTIADNFTIFSTFTDNSTTMSAIVASSTAMNIIAASATARTVIGTSGTKFNTISTSNMAIGKYVAGLVGLTPSDYADMTAVAASSTAMTAVAASSTARTAIDANSVAYNIIKTKTSSYLTYYMSSMLLILPMEGINDSTTFTDISTNARILTVNGQAKISTVQSKWGYGSGYFDGGGDYIVNTNIGSFGTSDFTIECWLYHLLRDDPNSVILAFQTTDNNADGFKLYIDSSGILHLFSGASQDLLSTNEISICVWTHVALTRTSYVCKMYINGIVQNYTNSVVANYTSTRFDAGGVSYNQYYNGYIQDVIVAKSVVRYTSNFTVPTRINS